MNDIIRRVKQAKYSQQIEAIKTANRFLQMASSGLKLATSAHAVKLCTTSAESASFTTKQAMRNLQRWQKQDSSLTIYEKNQQAHRINEVHKAFVHEYDHFSQTMIERSRRQLRLLQDSSDPSSPALSEDHIQDIIFRADPNEVDTLFQKALVSDQLRLVVDELEDRHALIRKLEKDVREIFELFTDLNALVVLQEDSLNVIDQNIGKALRHTEKAELQLQEAEGYSRRTRQLKCCCVLLCVGIVVAIVLPVVLTRIS
jgi:syntaxin 1B/2/3